LTGLFKRSFPKADVYGTRFVTEGPELSWINDYTIEARAAFSSLPKYYRQKKEDFPGTAYLTADPERRLQWKSLFDTLGKRPKIGIAWTGGSKKTGSQRRRLTLEMLLPILSQDCTFISLEYKNRDKEIKEFQKKHGIKIHHWNRAVDTYDYDDTAGLVAELDMVIGINTAVLHLAGGLGIKTLALIPEWPIWVWGHKGDSVPWSKDLKIFRQKGSWESAISRLAHELRDTCTKR
jgi:ADP-heptose:LPS heptosyltransferase